MSWLNKIPPSSPLTPTLLYEEDWKARLVQINTCLHQALAHITELKQFNKDIVDSVASLHIQDALTQRGVPCTDEQRAQTEANRNWLTLLKVTTPITEAAVACHCAVLVLLWARHPDNPRQVNGCLERQYFKQSMADQKTAFGAFERAIRNLYPEQAAQAGIALNCLRIAQDVALREDPIAQEDILRRLEGCRISSRAIA